MTKQELQEKAATLTTEQRSRIRRWVRALKSGRYDKTEGTLRDAGGWCCLGVACDVYRKATGGAGIWEKDAQGSLTGGFKIVGDDVTHGSMPDEVAGWFGFTVGDPRLVGRRGQGYETEYASTFNDELGYSLARIGDKIKATYLGARRARKS